MVEKQRKQLPSYLIEETASLGKRIRYAFEKIVAVGVEDESLFWMMRSEDCAAIPVEVQTHMSLTLPVLYSTTEEVLGCQ